MKNTRYARLGLVTIAAVLAVAMPAAAATDLAVTGSGQIQFGASRERVTLRSGGSEGGQMLVVDHTVSGTFVLRVDIDCVRIVGSEVTLSGVVTSSNDPTLEGFEALVQIVDSGEGSAEPDLMSPVLLHEVGIGPNCLVPSEFDLVPVEGGDFRLTS